MTGIIQTDGTDKKNRIYPKHPDSGRKFKGFQIPQYEKLLALVENVHKKLNTIYQYYPYVGWDFALSKNGWVLVEGNWGYFVSQYILKTGIRKKFLKCF